MKKEPVRTPHPSAAKRTSWLLLAFLLLLVGGCAVGVCRFFFASAEKALFYETEQTLLSASQNRVNALALQVGALKTQIRALSDSDMVRLFAMEAHSVRLDMSASQQSGSIPETFKRLKQQTPVMRSLLNDLLKQSSFTSISLLGPSLNPYVATSSRSSRFMLSPGEQHVARQAMQQGSLLTNIVEENDGELVLRFLQPVFSPKYVPNPETVVSVMLLDIHADSLLVSLKPDGRTPEDVRIRFLQHRFGQLEELSLGSGKSQILYRWSLDHQGSLPPEIRFAPDGKPVFSVATPLPETPFLIEAELPMERLLLGLAKEKERILVLVLVSALAAAFFLATIWWWMLGRREKHVSREMERLYHVVNQQKQLLDGINDALTDGIVLTDASDKVTYANEAFATIMGMSVAELISRANEDSLDAKRLRFLIRHTAETLNSGDSVMSTESFTADNGMERIYNIVCTPYRDENCVVTGVVGVYRDVTETTRAIKRVQTTISNTVNVLVRAIEAVDPYLRGHSMFIGRLAVSICRQIGLSSVHEETVRTAANLSQIGMIQLPRELVTKAGRLTPEERRQLETHVLYARTSLEGIDFDLPILPTICQMHERLDGSGYPEKLQGENILLDARILAVANTFCAVLRPRAYRGARSVQDAMNILMEQPPKYDATIVRYLNDYLRTSQGESFIRELQQDNEATA